MPLWRLEGRFDHEIQGFFSTLADRIFDEWPDPAGLGPPISNGMDAAGKQRARSPCGQPSASVASRLTTYAKDDTAMPFRHGVSCSDRSFRYRERSQSRRQYPMAEWSLAQLLSSLHDDIQQRLATVRKTLNHPGSKGDASENVWISILKTTCRALSIGKGPCR